MGTRADLSTGAWRLRMPLLAFALVGASAVSAASPNAGLARTPPDGRAYELVSPVDKGPSDAGPALGSSPDGNRFAYYTLGGSGGSPSSVSTANSFVAVRGSDGWASRSMQPPIGYPNLGLEGSYNPSDFSEDLSRSITLSRSAASEPAAQNVFATDLDGISTWITSPAPGVTIGTYGDKAYAGRSADASHIFFQSTQPYRNGVQGGQIWEWFDGQVRLASVLPDGTPSGGAVGNGTNASASGGTTFQGFLPQPDAVTEDGSKVFFQRVTELLVRENGTSTRRLSLSQRAGSVGQPPPSFGLSFVGASADGDVAVFRSADLLTNDATPNGGLYAFDLRSGVLRFLSTGSTDPSGANVEGVALVSRDGSRVYFVASSVLVPGKGVAGGHNLYVANPDGVKYITTLGNDDAQDWGSGTGSTAGPSVRATRDGRYFVFQSWERLTSIDNHAHSEIYIYDDTHGTIACVSCGNGGHVPAGDASIFANPVPRGQALQLSQLGRPRTITADGSRIYFQTTDPLVPEDSNQAADVYEYRTDSGQVALISGGTGDRDSEILDNTPDGRDVFFTTRDSLVRRDIDRGQRDVYDARVGGGFPDAAEPVPCTGDACQAPLTNAPTPPASPTDVRLNGGVKDLRAPRLFLQRITATGRRNVTKTGRLTLVATVEAAGTITASGTASYGDHRVRKLKSVRTTTKAAGTRYLHLSLPSAVRDQLKRHKRVTLSITVSYDKSSRPARLSLTLR